MKVRHDVELELLLVDFDLAVRVELVAVACVAKPVNVII